MTLMAAKALPRLGDVSRHHVTDQTDHTAGHDADQFAARTTSGYGLRSLTVDHTMIERP